MSIFRNRAWHLAAVFVALVLAVSACSTAVPTSTTGQSPAAATSGHVAGTLAAPAPAASAETPLAASASNSASSEGTPGATTTTPPGALTSPFMTPSALSGTAVAGTPSASSLTTSGTLPLTGNTAGVNAVTFTGVEYSYQGPSSILGGWTQITFQNKGQQPHDLQLFELAAGKTISDVVTALAGPSAPDWVSAYGGVSVAPGQSDSFLVNLKPGTYVMLSFGQAAQNQMPDAARGMLKELTVTQTPSATAQPTLPQPGVMVDMVDYSFVVTGTFQSGKQTVLITNKGTETHEATFMRLKAGKTMTDFMSALQGEMSGTPTPPDQLPFEAAQSGNISLAPGVSAYVTVELQAGDYVLACFIPSPKNGGKPHAALGMLRQVTVK